MEIITTIEFFEIFPAGTQPGIDVSHYQDTVDWNAVADTGVLFAFAKASEGTGSGSADPTFATNWQGMSDAGLLRGAYHFFHPNLDAAAQAEAFLASLANANGGSAVLNPGDLPAVLDLEVTDSVSPADVIAGSAKWLRMVANGTGRQPLLYTYVEFWRDMLGNSAELAQYPLWIANYDVNSPTVPGGWSDWTFWQFGSGPLSGITNGAVDLDAFNGTLDQLLVLACAESI